MSHNTFIHVYYKFTLTISCDRSIKIYEICPDDVLKSHRKSQRKETIAVTKIINGVQSKRCTCVISYKYIPNKFIGIHKELQNYSQSVHHTVCNPVHKTTFTDVIHDFVPHSLRR